MPNRIKELREARGLTLDQVAERANTSFQQVQRLEKGTRRLTDDWMRRIAKAIGVRPADLLSDSAPDSERLLKEAEKAMVWEIWDIMSPDQRALWLGFARDKGLKILADKAQKRSA